jgi:hypothetical protein
MIPPDDATPDDPGHSQQNSHLELLATALGELKQRESGLSFIYGALQLIAEWHDLTDAVVVLVNDALGTQIFRLGGKRVTTWSAERLAPGLYCWPDIMPLDQREIVYAACQQAFNEPVQRRSAASGRFGVGRHLEQKQEPQSLPPKESGATDGAVGVSARRLISRVLLLVDLAVFFMTIVDGHGVLRYVLGLVLGVVIPGWSVVGLLKLNNAALEIALTIAVSLAMVMVAAQILVTLKLWHPLVLEEFTCLLCAPALVVQSQLRGVIWAR